MRPFLAVVTVGLCLVGCAPLTAVSGKLTVAEQGFEVDVPTGWYRVQPFGRGQLAAAGVPFPALLIERSGHGLLLTQDGLLLQAIRVERIPVDKELPHTKRRIAADMPVHDLAELEVDNVRSDPEALNFELLENAPSTIGGRAGFRLVYTWKTRSGLRLKAVHYGFLERTALYRIVYQAADRYYFEKDLKTFEQLKQSFHLLDAKA